MPYGAHGVPTASYSADVPGSLRELPGTEEGEDVRLIFETTELQKLLDPSKRDPQEEAYRRAFLDESREMGRTLVIKSAPASPPPAQPISALEDELCQASN